MQVPVKFPHVWKHKSVLLSRMLPVDRSFGNKHPVPEGAKGYVISNGFEKGRLKVLFDLYAGKETVEFNELSARFYLTSDLALFKPE